MSLGREIQWLNPTTIQILENRQRSGKIETSDLLPSIRERGILNPIIISKELVLVAGERRLRCALELGLSEAPFRFDGDLSPLERRIVELEENERRMDLPWQDQVRAIAELHRLYEEKALAEEEKWSISKTAEILFYDYSHVTHILRVHKDLDSPRLKDAPGLRAAYNILSRIDERKIGDAMESISRAGASVAAKAETKPAAASPGTSGEQAKPFDPPPPQLPPEELSILQLDFIAWSETYTGARFNLVHFDPPYGVNLFEGEQGGKGKWLGYDDDPNVYWKLLKAFCANRDNFMSSSAHLMLWLTADIETQFETLQLFAKLAPEMSFCPKPLIWHKTNNVGILSDPKRRPRHIYETMLIASRGDRLILQASSDLYGCPTDKDHHASTKPEPMLRYFMRMFVDEHTLLLDPTCGSGAALRAAESLNAKHVLGLEIDPEHCTNARSALRQFRTKAAIARRTA